MKNFDLQAELTEEELRHFFSKTDEYKVEKIKESTYKINYEAFNGIQERIIYKPTIQTLIRDIASAAYLEGYERKEDNIKRGIK